MTKPSQVRQKEILDLLQDSHHCTITQLCDRFSVSIPTVHRDIDELVSNGKAEKIHGGVQYLPVHDNGSSGNASFQVRVNRQKQAKREIAHKALSLIEEDDVIFMDSSTTVLHLARELANSKIGRVTVITNSCSVANEFHTFPQHMTLISVGGAYNAQLHSFLGSITQQTLDQLPITKAFVSAVGVSENGLYTFHEPHADFLKHLLSRSSNNILLADASKFNRQAVFHICDLNQINTIVSDRKIPKEAIKYLKTKKSVIL
tara:strand:- start:11525 stop:12304 length:780 start_codon:yes stop_codon:yes gene_type:complete